MSTSILINLLFQADDGLIQYPYSTREVVNIVKHLERFPEEGLGAVVRDAAYSHNTTIGATKSLQIYAKKAIFKGWGSCF